MHPEEKLSRRTLLKKGSVLLAGIAILPAVLQSHSALAGTGSKKDFNYQDHPRDGKTCAHCGSYISSGKAAGTCRILAGSISPQGWCIAYSEKE
jgi:hypothetical protein